MAKAFVTDMAAIDMIIHALQHATEEVRSVIAVDCVLDEVDGSGGDGLNFIVTKGDKWHTPSVSFKSIMIEDSDMWMFDFGTQEWVMSGC